LGAVILASPSVPERSCTSISSPRTCILAETDCEGYKPGTRFFHRRYIQFLGKHRPSPDTSAVAFRIDHTQVRLHPRRPAQRGAFRLQPSDHISPGKSRTACASIVDWRRRRRPAVLPCSLGCQTPFPKSP
jgi:hypothetical protein